MVTRRLASCFAGPLTLRHDGGHYVPTKGVLVRPVRDFIVAQASAICGSDTSAAATGGSSGINGDAGRGAGAGAGAGQDVVVGSTTSTSVAQ